MIHIIYVCVYIYIYIYIYIYTPWERGASRRWTAAGFRTSDRWSSELRRDCAAAPRPLLALRFGGNLS